MRKFKFQRIDKNSKSIRGCDTPVLRRHRQKKPAVLGRAECLSCKSEFGIREEKVRKVGFITTQMRRAILDAMLLVNIYLHADRESIALVRALQD